MSEADSSSQQISQNFESKILDLLISDIYSRMKYITVKALLEPENKEPSIFRRTSEAMVKTSLDKFHQVCK